MKRVKKYISILTMALAALFMVNCTQTVLEFPEGEGVDPTLVTTTLNFVIDPRIEPYSKAINESVYDENHDIRFIIELYKDEMSGTPVQRFVRTCAPSVGSTIKIDTELNAGYYYIVAWADFVDKGSVADKYYNVPSLDAITIPQTGTYIGDEDCKDTYLAVDVLDLTGYFETWYGSVQKITVLERPMAKIEVIATDVRRFMANLASLLQTNTALYESLSSNALNIEGLNITLSYDGFFPSGYNVFTDRPNDSRQGVQFTCSATRLSDDQARLASDYVFVNGNESAVMVSLLITDDDGNIVNQVGGINVPIERGKLTTISDEFLTKSYSPGIGINPDFEGVIEVVIPD